MSKILIIRGFYKEGERDYINVRKQFPQLFNSKIVKYGTNRGFFMR